MEHSSWFYNDQEVPFVPANERIIPALLSQNLHTAFSIMLEDLNAVEQARIQVEKINGPILIWAAKKDEMWPSFDMSLQLIERLKSNQFPHHFEHITTEGDLASPFNQFSYIFKFLDQHFKKDSVSLRWVGFNLFGE